jgi:hypothetical protein
VALLGEFVDWVFWRLHPREESLGGASEILAQAWGDAVPSLHGKEAGVMGGVMEIEDACRLIGYGWEFCKVMVPAVVLAACAWRVGA